MDDIVSGSTISGRGDELEITELFHVMDVSEFVGYEDSNYFIKVFKKYTGVTPSNYRESFW